MLIKVQGEFVWHQLQDTDELFLVIDGQLHIQLHNHHDVLLRPGERLVVPRGVRHCLAADQETRVLFLELRDMVDTGDADNDGFLTMEEVLALKLDADMVVLSA